MKFIDEAKINVTSGNGGAGMSHFLREKFNSMGGPDGGDGGHGGSVIVRSNKNTHTLLDFKFRPIWKAGNGKGGDVRNRTGADGADLIIDLPIGTQIYSKETKELVFDLNKPGQEYVLLKGGKGGKGNMFFKSATNQAPTHAQTGMPGQSGEFILNLKLVADVGLVGFPNAGKSTLISCVSAAKPKIADYPFTTLTPNLGVVQGKNRNFVIADIPGIIPGASSGKGLGITFLKHIERTKIIAYIIDPYTVDEAGEPMLPHEVYTALKQELKSFIETSEESAEEKGYIQDFQASLIDRPAIIVITKIDTFPPDFDPNDLLEGLPNDLKVMLVSSISKENLSDLTLELETIVAMERS